jgi:DEAD/DEAH box helicase domain-containing protein
MHSNPAKSSGGLTAESLCEILGSLSAARWSSVDCVERPAVAPRTAAVPSTIHERLQARLASRYPGGIYRHQALALGHLAEGADVALTTPTSSGKSLVFIAGALNLLLRNPSARIIALYPVKALGNDQLGKWEEALAPFGMSVGVIDGDTPMKSRHEVLSSNEVIIMTPDILHAWFMSNLHDPQIREFRGQLSMVILDEAHVYDGVFGAGTAYLLRRLDACGGHFQLIASSATVGRVDEFLGKLTGRNLCKVDATEDGSPRHQVAWHRLVYGGKDSIEARVVLLRELAARGVRFMAFADSRKAAELHAAALRRGATSVDAGDEGLDDGPVTVDGILPYRSGYEAEDRQAIEQALASGQLRGVVATSAMELGVDIPGIDCVVLIGEPPSQKSLWQRAGRTGRHGAGAVFLLGSSGNHPAPLVEILGRPIEPNHLCLDNRFLEYIHVLCAAHEAGAIGDRWNPDPISSISETTAALLEGERQGGEEIPDDLFDLKARAGGNPQRAFSLRNGRDNNFEIHLGGERVGTISFPQLFREAYPGAVYYHMGRPYRVRRVNRTQGTVDISREKHWTTTPQFHSHVSIKLMPGDTAMAGPGGFVYSGDLQITERVSGFTEKKSPVVSSNEQYGPGSPWARRPFDRMLRSTGICWALESAAAPSDEAAERILSTASSRFGLCRSDLGIARFRSRTNPWGSSPTTGLCIYDRVEGGLHLTDAIYLNFAEIVAAALAAALEDEAPEPVISYLEALAAAAQGWTDQTNSVDGAEAPANDPDTIEVITQGSPAFYVHGDHHESVTVVNSVPGPDGDGLHYLVRLSAGDFKTVKSRYIHPHEGESNTMRLPRRLFERAAALV